MKIEVTCDDIMQGVRRSNQTCPVALAIKRSKGVCSVHVNEWCVSCSDGPFRALPPEARRFIRAFDSDDKVMPFTFEL